MTKCAECVFATVDEATSDRNWTAYQCENQESEYYHALLNVTIRGDRLTEISWIGCEEGKEMDKYMEKRAVDCAEYIASTGGTIRAAASVFGVCKSTVHSDVTRILPEIDERLAGEVRSVLDTNKREAPLRGAAAIRAKRLRSYRPAERGRE